LHVENVSRALYSLNPHVWRSAPSTPDVSTPIPSPIQLDSPLREEVAPEVEPENTIVEIVPMVAEEAVSMATEPDVIAQIPEPAEQSQSSVVIEAFGEEETNAVYHNPNPLFATDGRGRVVWSNRGEGCVSSVG